MIGDYRRVYGKLFLMPNICCSLWSKPHCFFVVWANRTFWLSALEFSLCHSSLWEDCHGAGLLALSKWLLRYTEDRNNDAPPWCFPSPLAILLTSISWSFCSYPTVQEVLFSCSQYLWGKEFCEFTHHKWWSRTDGAAIK